MMEEITPPALDFYKTRIEISRDGQNTLYTERARRQLKGERLTLIDLASEIMEKALADLKIQQEASPVG